MKEYKGFDISYCQRGLPVSALKAAGADFVIIRAGFSETQDRDSNDFVKECHEIGMPYGFYWYSYANGVDEVKKEANACLAVIKKYSPTLPIYFDMEEPKVFNYSKDTRTNMILEFCKIIAKAGYKAGVYANPSLLNVVDTSKIVGKYDIWLAHWTSAKSRYIDTYGAKVWQWGTDSVNYNTKWIVDADICYTDEYFKVKPVTKPAQNTTINPSTSNSSGSDKFKLGDTITLNNTPLYASATILNATNKLSGTFYIHDNEVIGNRMRITTSNGNPSVTGWVNISDIKLKSATQATTTTAKPTVTTNTSTTTTAKFKKGDVVKITGSKYYTGLTIPTWVKAKTWKVYSVSGDRVVINESTDGQNAIMSAVKASNLAAVGMTSTPVNKSEISKGDLVAITGNKYYNGSTIPYWVKCKNWYVLTATPGNDRIVINKSEDGQNAIMSAVARDSLKIVKKQ